MPIPGMGRPAMQRTVAIAPGYSYNYDLAAALGNPTDPVRYNLFVSSGAYIGSASVLDAALDATGLHQDSVGRWYLSGDIIGAGGRGGDAYPETAPVSPVSSDNDTGAGGGGAGLVAGVGGTAWHNAPAGSDGDVWPVGTTGGTGGVSDYHPGNAPELGGPFTRPSDGGDGIHLNHQVSIDFSGNIGGGGGGGAPGLGLIKSVPLEWYYSEGGDGGDLGQDGNKGVVPPGEFERAINGFLYSYTEASGLAGPPGVAGYAIRYSGIGAATITGAGTVYGTVG